VVWANWWGTATTQETGGSINLSSWELFSETGAKLCNCPASQTSCRV